MYFLGLFITFSVSLQSNITPFFNTTILSAIDWIREISWEIKIKLIDISSLILSKSSRINFWIFLSRADTHSSQIKTFGDIEIALAITTLCLSPPESSDGSLLWSFEFKFTLSRIEVARSFKSLLAAILWNLSTSIIWFITFIEGSREA